MKNSIKSKKDEWILPKNIGRNKRQNDQKTEFLPSKKKFRVVKDCAEAEELSEDDDYEGQLMYRIDDHTLREVFAGLCR